MAIGEETLVSCAISQISEKERERISYFFEHAIFWDGYGYVLLGDKPCAITSYKRMTLNPFSWLESLSPHNLKMKKGWKTWLKWEKLFPHPNFVFLEEDSDLTAAHLVVLVHRNHFLQKVNDHQNDFRSVLQTTNGENLLFEGQEKPFLAQVLKNHDGLIGTLLGYGRNNGWAFHEKSKVMQSFIDTQEHLRIENFCKNLGSWKFFTGSFVRDLSQLPLPGFFIDPADPESRRLKITYRKNRQKIISHYQDKKFLETTLKLLCETN